MRAGEVVDLFLHHADEIGLADFLDLKINRERVGGERDIRGFRVEIEGGDGGDAVDAGDDGLKFRQFKLGDLRRQQAEIEREIEIIQAPKEGAAECQIANVEIVGGQRIDIRARVERGGDVEAEAEIGNLQHQIVGAERLRVDAEAVEEGREIEVDIRAGNLDRDFAVIRALGEGDYGFAVNLDISQLNLEQIARLSDGEVDETVARAFIERLEIGGGGLNAVGGLESLFEGVSDHGVHCVFERGDGAYRVEAQQFAHVGAVDREEVDNAEIILKSGVEDAGDRIGVVIDEAVDVVLELLKR